MDFRLTAEQQLLADSVREFCAREVIPFARSWDEAEDFPHELVPKLAAMGLWGMRVPEAYGGASGSDTGGAAGGDSSRAKKKYAFRRGEPGKPEDSWTAIQRLAEEVG